MAIDLTKGSLPKQPRSAAEAKSETTTRIARSMFETEAAARKAKTEKLRQARLAKEAAKAPVAVAATATKKKPARRAGS